MKIKKKVESTERWKTIHYDIPIQGLRVITEKSGKRTKDFFISGDAIHETISRNNYKYTAEELTKAADTLTGKPILKDHDQSVDSIVGKVINSEFRDGAIKFKGQIMEEKIKGMIDDGRIQNVSIGASVDDIIKETDGDQEIMLVKGLEFLELSLVAVPGDPMAGIEQALKESFKQKLKQKIVGEKEMDEKDIIAIVQSEMAKLKEQDEEHPCPPGQKWDPDQGKCVPEKAAEQEEPTAPAAGQPAPEAPPEEPPLQEPQTAPAIKVEPVTVDGEPQIQITPATEKYIRRVVKEAVGATGTPRGRVVKETQRSRVRKEGNKLIIEDSKGTFVKEYTRDGCQLYRL